MVARSVAGVSDRCERIGFELAGSAANRAICLGVRRSSLKSRQSLEIRREGLLEQPRTEIGAGLMGTNLNDFKVSHQTTNLGVLSLNQGITKRNNLAVRSSFFYFFDLFFYLQLSPGDLLKHAR
jgi:hypothetical protein